MRIKIIVPPILQQLTGNKETVYVAGTTIRECMEDFNRQFPDSQESFAENGPVARVTANQKIVGMTELDQKVTEDDELRFVSVLAGC